MFQNFSRIGVELLDACDLSVLSKSVLSDWSNQFKLVYSDAVINTFVPKCLGKKI